VSYPAFQGLLNILNGIIGLKRILLLSWSYRESSKLVGYLLMEILTSFNLLRAYKKHNFKAVLIYQGYMPLTCLMTKLLRKKLLLFIGGSYFKAGFYDSLNHISKLKAYFRRIQEFICHNLSDKIIVLSKSMVKWIGLQPYLDKVSIAPDYPNNLIGKFYVMKPYKSREMCIGYVGALRKCKGPHLLIEAIPYILKEIKNITFLIVGDGPLRETLKRMIKEYNIEKNVKMIGRVSHSDLTYYYNQMRLLVVPSFTEGLPAVILEAMACGVPVLATPVGGIADIIYDGENGFLLKSNHPQEIAKRVVELMKNHNALLEKVSERSALFIKEKFNEKSVAEAWKRIFKQLFFPNNK